MSKDLCLNFTNLCLLKFLSWLLYNKTKITKVASLRQYSVGWIFWCKKKILFDPGYQQLDSVKLLTNNALAYPFYLARVNGIELNLRESSFQCGQEKCFSWVIKLPISDHLFQLFVMQTWFACGENQKGERESGPEWGFYDFYYDNQLLRLAGRNGRVDPMFCVIGFLGLC